MNSENELDTTCGVSDEELTRRFREAVRIENEIKGLPIAGYDHDRRQAYIEYPNGRREYAESLHTLEKSIAQPAHA